MSEHKSLLVALHAFQAEAPALKKDAVNPAFRSKYVSLDAIVETTRPLLVKHGLLWSTFPSQDEHGKPTLKYEISHPASGETKAGEMPLLLTKNDPQGQGSAITYARRYSVCAVLNLVADEDDDGNKASEKGAAKHKTNGTPTTARAPQATEKPATAKQRGLINAKAGEKSLTAEDLANILLAVGGQPTRLFDNDEQARQFVNRNLDRLPGRSVDGVLAAIEQADPQDIPA